MKRTIAIIAVIALCQTLAFGQKKYKMVVETTDGNSVTFPTENIKRIYFLESNVSYNACPDGNHPHLIDLGLPSGTKWACCNIGANAPGDYGNYYAWGETQPKEVYNWSNYIHCDGSSSTCHDIGLDIAGTQYDAATANWGAPWRMPSREQCEEFRTNCTYVWTSMDGVEGLRFTGPNGGSIFLPAAGNRWNNELANATVYGLYWSSTRYYAFLDKGYTFAFYSNYASWTDSSVAYGQPVRPVSK